MLALRLDKNPKPPPEPSGALVSLTLVGMSPRAARESWAASTLMASTTPVVLPPLSVMAAYL